MLRKANLDEYSSFEDLAIVVDGLDLSDKQYKKLMYYVQQLADEIYQNAFEEGQENG